MATIFELKDEILNGRRVKRMRWLGPYERLDLFFAAPCDMFADDWELEPLPKVKKKITMYQVVYKYKEQEDWFLSKDIFKNKEDFYKQCSKNVGGIGFIPVEVEVEE